ncbi:MAG: DUF3179 domain-containing protein [Gammaproteobacteria bacterium]|nr:DUF3179 domain-containing protein [Gammaproteobacteria bacterium]
MKKNTSGRLFFYLIFLIAISFIFKEQLLAAFTQNNGFDLSDSLINVQEIHHGGPAKDGIPAIDRPIYISAAQATSLMPEDRILGLSINGIAKAYPIKILNYHEIVNDFFHDQPVVITYCPLCGSGVAYSAHINNINTTFGVSGLLYNSDVLLYDRETESLWSQLLSKAISGKQKGTELDMLALTHTSWQDWHKQYPDTLVLSEKTGFNRDYAHSPYGGYEKSRSLYFPVKRLNTQYHPKEYVIGLKIAGQSKVYPFAELAKIQSPHKDVFARHEIIVLFDAKNRTGKILDNNHKEIPTTISFWFAWMAFYPESVIFKGL